VGASPAPLGGRGSPPAESPHRRTRPALASRLPVEIVMLTVLIADDEPYVVDLIRLTLEDERISVIDAYDGETALAHAEAMRPELIFLDVQLPDISGLEVCARLRSDPRFAGTKIVMLTAAAQEADVARGLAAGANHYLTKPFSPVRLLSLVESVVPHAAVWQHE
jgi:DNA-binding response OmpR family regulator